MEGAGPLPETVLAADIVEVTAGPGPAIRSARRAMARPVPRWEADGRDRVRTAARALAGPLADLAARGADPDDTRRLVTGFLRDGLGYGRPDLIADYQVKPPPPPPHSGPSSPATPSSARSARNSGAGPARMWTRRN